MASFPTEVDFAALSQQLQSIQDQLQKGQTRTMMKPGTPHDRSLSDAMILSGECPAGLQACDPTAEALKGRSCPDIRTYAPDPLLVDKHGRICYAPKDLAEWAGAASFSDLDTLVERAASELLGLMSDAGVINTVKRKLLGASVRNSTKPRVWGEAMCKTKATDGSGCSEWSPTLVQDYDPHILRQGLAFAINMYNGRDVTDPSGFDAAPAASGAAPAAPAAGRRPIRRGETPVQPTGTLWDRAIGAATAVRDAVVVEPQDNPFFAGVDPLAGPDPVDSADLPSSWLDALNNFWGNDMDESDNLSIDEETAPATPKPLHFPGLGKAKLAGGFVPEWPGNKKPNLTPARYDVVFTGWTDPWWPGGDKLPAYTKPLNPATLAFAGAWAWAFKADQTARRMGEAFEAKNLAIVMRLPGIILQVNAAVGRGLVAYFPKRTGSPGIQLKNLTFDVAWPMFADRGIGIGRLLKAAETVKDLDMTADEMEKFNKKSAAEQWDAIIQRYAVIKV